MRKNKFRTDFLLQKNNFLIGLGSVLSIEGNYFEFNKSKSSQDADIKALKSDWYNIGEDIRESINSIKLKEGIY